MEGAVPEQGAVPDPDRILRAGADALGSSRGDYVSRARKALRAMLEEAGIKRGSSHDTSRQGDAGAVLTRSITLRGQIALLRAAFPERESPDGQMMMVPTDWPA